MVKKRKINRSINSGLTGIKILIKDRYYLGKWTNSKIDFKEN